MREFSAQPESNRVWVSARAQHVVRRGASRGSPEARGMSRAALGGSGGERERERAQKKNAFVFVRTLNYYMSSII